MYAKVILRHDDGKRGEIDEKEASNGFDFTHTGGNGEGIAAFATGSLYDARALGSSIEVHNAQTSLVQVKWQQRCFVVHLPELLDACRVEDLGEIISRSVSESSSAES